MGEIDEVESKTKSLVLLVFATFGCVGVVKCVAWFGVQISLVD